MPDNNCEGHAKMSVADNVATIDIWCSGTCSGGKCTAAWTGSGDIGDLHLRNGYASDDDSGTRHQVRQYEIRDTVTNIQIPFTCDCGDTAKKFYLPIERLEPGLTVGDVIIKIIEIIFTLGVPLIIKLASKKGSAAVDVAQTVQAMHAEIGKAVKPN